MPIFVSFFPLDFLTFHLYILCHVDISIHLRWASIANLLLVPLHVLPLAPVSSSANICNGVSIAHARRGLSFAGLSGGFHRGLSSETGGFQEAAYIHTSSQGLVKEYLGARICRYCSSLIRGADTQQGEDLKSLTCSRCMTVSSSPRPSMGPCMLCYATDRHGAPKPGMIFDSRSRDSGRVECCSCRNPINTAKVRNAAL